jgi:hypothetical protein
LTSVVLVWRALSAAATRARPTISRFPETPASRGERVRSLQHGARSPWKKASR